MKEEKLSKAAEHQAVQSIGARFGVPKLYRVNLQTTMASACELTGIRLLGLEHTLFPYVVDVENTISKANPTDILVSELAMYPDYPYIVADSKRSGIHKYWSIVAVDPFSMGTFINIQAMDNQPRILLKATRIEDEPVVLIATQLVSLEPCNM